MYTLVSFVRKFLDENPFIACSEELSYIKDKLITDQDQLKIKQKAGAMSICAKENR